MPYARHETIADRIKRAGLPQSHDIHWSQDRKADVVHAVRDHVIEFEEARGRYLLSRKEYRAWEEQVDEAEAKQPETEPA